jgi:hypothetical protein
MTRADAAGFERWLAYDIHAHGLAALQKNDPANASTDASLFDGMIIEECNYYRDPCAGPGGDADAYLAAGKPVLNAEYTQDGEAAARFCSADLAAGIAGALFDVGLSGGVSRPCAPAAAAATSARYPGARLDARDHAGAGLLQRREARRRAFGDAGGETSARHVLHRWARAPDRASPAEPTRAFARRAPAREPCAGGHRGARHAGARDAAAGVRDLLRR